MVLCFPPLTIPNVSEITERFEIETPKTHFHQLSISLLKLKYRNLETQRILYSIFLTLACYREYAPSCKGRWHSITSKASQMMQHWERFCNITVSWPRITISFLCLLPESNQILNSESKLDSDIPLHGIWVKKIIRVHMTTVLKHAIIVDILAVFQLQPLKLYLILKLDFVSRLCL